VTHASVLLVDDHALVRDALASQLQGEVDMTVVGVASDADEALEMTLRIEPDVVLFDIDMPGLSSFNAAKAISERCDATRILFLSGFFHDHYIAEALESGAAGYLTKREPYGVVVKAIRSVANGDSFFSEEVQLRIVVNADGPSLAKCKTRADTLTTREKEILRYIARGLSKKEIAKLVHLSVNTVDVHTSRVMSKLDIHDRVGLARFAIREGLSEA
jgi:DNA-binding NarL/FixJ family response regulator